MVKISSLVGPRNGKAEVIPNGSEIDCQRELPQRLIENHVSDATEEVERRAEFPNTEARAVVPVRLRPKSVGAGCPWNCEIGRVGYDDAMLRFGTRSLLIGFAILAAWLSTIAAYPGSGDVRAIILLLVLVAAAFTAIYNPGRQRAFWAGVFVIMLATQISPRVVTSPRFNDITQRATNFALGLEPDFTTTRGGLSRERSLRYLALQGALRGAFEVALALVGGMVAGYIYDQSRKTVPHNRV